MKRARLFVLASATVLCLMPAFLGAASASAHPAPRTPASSPFLRAHRAHHRWHISTMRRQEVVVARFHSTLPQRAPFLARGIRPMIQGNQALHGWMESVDNGALASHEGGQWW